MNPNFVNPYIYPLYMPYNNHQLQHQYHSAWDQHSINPEVKGNLVHVNPAFLQPPLAPIAQHSNSNKVIVNPRFFPQAHNAKLLSNVAPNQVTITSGRDLRSMQPSREPPVRVVLPSNEKPKPISEPPRFKIKTKLKVVNIPASGATSSSRPSEETKVQMPISKRLVIPVASKPSPIAANNRLVKQRPKVKLLQMNLKNKYKWKKGESPLKPLLLKNAYKLIRKSSPTKSPRLSLSLKIPPLNGLMILTPPKLSSTPIESGGVFSRFKLDNRNKDKKKPTKAALCVLNKILKNKYKFDRSKTSKPNSSIIIRTGHNFSNFNTFNKSLLSRSKLQRTVNLRKFTKSPKKSKGAAKNKKSNRYYDSEMKLKQDEDTLEDVEIVANSSGPAPRAPIGTLPSFITL